jgi:DNA recombination protein RmuC
MVTAALFVLGVALGAAAAWLLASRRVRAADVRLADVRAELVGTRAELDVERRSFDEKVVAAVRAASAEAYQANSSAFLEIAESKLTGYVRPLKDSLDKVGVQVQTLEQARERSQGALREQLGQLSERTASLVTALRTPHVRGRWGEIQLKRVVELAGMLPYCDFDEQVTATTDDGRLRPDMRVRLPGGKSVIVDAKVPLAAYLDACEATDDAERARHLESHARQVREHMTKLSAKTYWQQFGDTPDFVVMFLPDEGFFRAAWEQDPSLVETGVRSRVHVASPTTLIVLLQSIAYGWQQESVAEDAREIQALGRELYERVAIVGSHMNKIGNSLKGAVGAFNDTVGSLEKRFLPTARKLEGHVVSDKELPELTPVVEQPQALQASELGEQLRAIDAA